MVQLHGPHLHGPQLYGPQLYGPLCCVNTNVFTGVPRTLIVRLPSGHGGPGRQVSMNYLGQQHLSPSHLASDVSVWSLWCEEVKVVSTVGIFDDRQVTLFL